jgi:hypothetical protein
VLATPARQTRIEFRLQWFIRQAFRHRDSLRFVVSALPKSAGLQRLDRYPTAESGRRGDRPA